MPEESRQVKVGDETITVARFRGLKAAEAGALISRVMESTPELQDLDAQFRQDYREKHTVKITPAMAKLEQFAVLGLTSEDFAAANGIVEFPDEPTNQQVMMAMWPHLFRLARKELECFLGLLVISNRDLEKADDEDRVEEAVKEEGKRIMRMGYVDELLELILLGIDVFREQLRRKRDSLGKLPIPWLQRLILEPEELPKSQEEESAEQETEPETPEPVEEEEVEVATNMPGLNENEELSPQQNSEPASSHDLPENMDGADEISSTVSPGVS